MSVVVVVCCSHLQFAIAAAAVATVKHQFLSHAVCTIYSFTNYMVHHENRYILSTFECKPAAWLVVAVAVFLNTIRLVGYFSLFATTTELNCCICFDATDYLRDF